MRQLLFAMAFHHYIFFIIILMIGKDILYPVYKNYKRKKVFYQNFRSGWRNFLQEKVLFYRRLNPEEKELFERKILDFVVDYDINGVDIDVDDFDRVLVAASAIIPVFRFPKWYYKDLKTIYLFRDSFNISHPMFPKGTQLNGLVGYGGIKNKMYLSRKALYDSFEKDFDGKHTGIHEFLHLIDMEDGDADGVPGILMPKAYIKPWKQLIDKEIERICNDDSVLNDYACENAVEFFAESGVAFFENPEELKEKHPELYRILEVIFMSKTK